MVLVDLGLHFKLGGMPRPFILLLIVLVRCSPSREPTLHHIPTLDEVIFPHFRLHNPCNLFCIIRPNIPLSATWSDHLTNLNTHTTYVPPHPQRGTPYHRYVTLLLPQPPISKYSLTTAARATGPTSQYLDIPVVPDDERHGFDVREFARKWGLDAASGGGAHMWRETWDKDVSLIYKDILSESPPPPSAFA